MIGVLVLLGSIVVARIISERAMKKLEPNKKSDLIDLFSGRAYTSIILLVILGLFFLNIKFEVIDSMIAYILYIISILAYSIVTGIQSYRKLKGNGFPDPYIQAHIISTTLRVVGLVAFFAIVF